MFQIIVIGNPLKFILNNLYHFLLDVPVICLHRFFHAADAGSEGKLIFWYLYYYIGCTLSRILYHLRIGSITFTDIGNI